MIGDKNWISITETYTNPSAKIPVSIIVLLAANEVRPGGPYYSLKTKEVSLTENLSILVMLLQHNITLEPLLKYVEERVAQIECENPLVLKYQQLLAEEVVDDQYLHVWDNLDLPEDPFLLRLKKNSFTQEILQQPYQLNEIFSLNLDLTVIERLTVTNLYGWIYFAILDIEIDGDGRVTKAMKLIMKESLREAFDSLQENSNIHWVKESVQAMKNEVNTISEESSITRSRPLYLPISAYLSPDQMEALDRYYLAKQYYDDLHDFMDDMAAGRKTLITVAITGADAQDEYLHKVLPNSLKRIEELIELVRPTLDGFPPLENLSDGLVDQYRLRREIEKLVSKKK